MKYLFFYSLVFLSFSPLSTWARINFTSPCQSLIDASDEGNLGKMASLVTLGVDVNCTNRENTYPLVSAAQGGKEKSVRWLLRHGADVNFHPTAGTTALYTAAIHHHLNIVKILIEAKAKININQKFNGWTALMAAAFDDEIEIFNFLLANGGDPFLTDWTGESALIKAAGHGSLNSIKILINLGANPAATDQNQNSSLTQAAKYCQADVMNYFLSLPGIYFDHEQLEKTLGNFSWGKCREGETFGARRNLSQLEIKEMIQKLSTKIGTVSAKTLRFSLIGITSTSSGAASIKYLASLGAPVNVQEMGITLLMNRCRYAHTEDVIALLEAGADPNLMSLNSYESELKSMSPLAFYVTQVWNLNQEELSLQVIQQFIKSGAKINFRDQKGKTVLTYAKERQQPWPKAIELLIKLGAIE